MIILDLDNTISDDSWRIPLINWKEQCKVRRFLSYHLGCKYDLAGNNHLWEEADDVVIFTARPYFFQSMTKKWLKDKGIQPKVRDIFFRPNNSTLPSPMLKNIFLQGLLYMNGMRKEEIECAYDDRPDVVEMYKASGINAKQVSIHNISILEIGKRESQ